MDCAAHSNAVSIGGSATQSINISSDWTQVKGGSATHVLTGDTSTLTAEVITSGSLSATRHLFFRAYDTIVLSARDIFFDSVGIASQGYVTVGTTASVVALNATSMTRTVINALTETAKSLTVSITNAYNVVCGSYSLGAGNGNITLTTTGTITLNGSIVNGAVPSGTIVMYGQSTAPPGWAICNGTNGTPDLRGRFVIGANPMGGLTNNGFYTSNIGSMGGLQNVVADHQHNTWDTKWSDERVPYPSYLLGYSGWAYREYNPSQYLGTPLTGTGASGYNSTNWYLGTREWSSPVAKTSAVMTTTDTRPPYYALVYIMKL